MMEFLTFKSFLSHEALITLYYIGVVIMPGGVLYLVKRLIQKYNNSDLEKVNNYVDIAYIKGEKSVWKLLNRKQKIKFIAFFVFLFLFLNLFWRMLFEFLIAYMQIHDSLQNVQL